VGDLVKRHVANTRGSGGALDPSEPNGARLDGCLVTP